MLLSAVSDLEVENEERDGTMWHILYPFSDGPQLDAEGRPMAGIHIATTRPETMLADGALAVHPEDDRYRGIGTSNALSEAHGGPGERERERPVAA